MKKLFLLLISALAFLTACEKSPEQVTLKGETMGTTYTVKYIDNGTINNKPEQIHQQIKLILKDVNAKMSTYIPTSELSLFNQNTDVNTPIPASADLAKVVGEAIRLNQVTEGALDVTVGPVVNLWGFGPDKRINKQPTPEQIAERKAWVGIDKLKLTKSAVEFYLEKSVAKLYVDLSSIAKGFGVDQVAEFMQNQNVENYMVEIGGEIRTKGKNAEGKYWQIAIEQPNFDGSRGVAKVIGLNNIAMATSGDYRNYFEDNGVRFSHEIDPKTCLPIQHNLASITVLHPSSMTADGLSTGLFVLGAEKALEIAERENLAVFLIIKNSSGYEIKMSSAFTKLIEG